MLFARNNGNKERLCSHELKKTYIKSTLNPLSCKTTIKTLVIIVAPNVLKKTTDQVNKSKFNLEIKMTPYQVNKKLEGGITIATANMIYYTIWTEGQVDLTRK